METAIDPIEVSIFRETVLKQLFGCCIGKAKLLGPTNLTMGCVVTLPSSQVARLLFPLKMCTSFAFWPAEACFGFSAPNFGHARGRSKTQVPPVAIKLAKEIN